MTDILMSSIATVSKLIAEKKLSPLEITSSLLQKIEDKNCTLNAFITVSGEEAMQQASELEQEQMRGTIRSALHGVPIAIKDIIQVKGHRTTSGSKVFEKWIPDKDALVVNRLKRAGAIIIGKTNLHEFAMGATSENPHYGNVKNPWDHRKIPGGSSGGSAVAVAAGLSYGALGTDTAGSIRLPAAFCGVVGLKPTYGLVSTKGCLPFSWSLDHIGPMTRTVKDSAIMFEWMTEGKSRKRPNLLNEQSFSFPEVRDLSGIKIGVCYEYLFEDLTVEISSIMTKVIERFEELGAEIVDVKLKHINEALNALKVIAQSEGLSFHEPLLEKYGHLYGHDVLHRFNFGKNISAIAYIQAQRKRKQFIQETLKAMDTIDVLIAPTNSRAPFDIGSVPPEEAINNMFTLGKTPLANILGFPSLSIPCGIVEERLPTAFQLIGKPFTEKLLMQIGECYERNENWFEKYVDIQELTRMD